MPETSPSEPKRRSSVQNLIDEAPDKYVFRLSVDEAAALSEDENFTQIGLTNIYANAPNFAAMMGYGGHKKHIFNSIVTEAIFAGQADLEIHYSRNRSGYGGCTEFGYQSVTKAVKFLSENRFVRDFIIAPSSANTLRSFFKPTLALIAHYSDYLKDWAPTLQPSSFAVEMTIRGEMDCPIYGTFKPKTRQKASKDMFEDISAEIIAQNEFLAEFAIDFLPPKDRLISRHKTIIRYINSKGNERVVNIARIPQKRIFLKKSPDDIIHYAGRFYGGFWQGLSSGDRSRIKIDGEWVGKEKDYTALHPRLAYALSRTNMPRNVYFGECPISDNFGHEDQWRKICKMALLISINAKNLKAAKGALALSLMRDRPDLYPIHEGGGSKAEVRVIARRDAKKIIKSVIEHNASIEEFILSDSGIKFQRIDGEIMANIQRACRNLGIPVLGVHDSILFPKSRHREAKRVFRDELENVLERLKQSKFESFNM